jgi:hypothetical protein
MNIKMKLSLLTPLLLSGVIFSGIALNATSCKSKSISLLDLLVKIELQLEKNKLNYNATPVDYSGSAIDSEEMCNAIQKQFMIDFNKVGFNALVHSNIVYGLFAL